MFVLLSHINEDKRKTEGQKQIFDVVYEVDGCPVSEVLLTLGVFAPAIKISEIRLTTSCG